MTGQRSVLVIGATGQVGRELIRTAPDWGHRALAWSRTDLDLGEPAPDLTGRLSRAAPDVVVNAAAYTAVDAAEQDREAALAVNRDGPGRLATTCAALDLPLIHLSTDYVFDGTARRPYRESDPASPLGVYGQSKWEGERLVRERLGKHLILRTAWVYASHGKNFVRTMLKLGRERPTLRVVDDQTGAPTSAREIAHAIHHMIGRLGQTPSPWGVYHFTGRGETTWYQFAKRIFQAAAPWYGAGPALVPIPTAEYPTPARRPAYSVLDCTKIEEAFALKRRLWTDPLEDVLAELRPMEEHPRS